MLELRLRLSKSSPFEAKMLVEFIRRGISDIQPFCQDYQWDSSTLLLKGATYE